MQIHISLTTEYPATLIKQPLEIYLPTFSESNANASRGFGHTKGFHPQAQKLELYLQIKQIQSTGLNSFLTDTSIRLDEHLLK